MMPLSLAQVGEENIIKRIGVSPEVKRHLENLGFVVGGEVTVINSDKLWLQVKTPANRAFIDS